MSLLPGWYEPSAFGQGQEVISAWLRLLTYTADRARTSDPVRRNCIYIDCVYTLQMLGLAVCALACIGCRLLWTAV
jgi:hypothetical protein